MFRTLIRAKRAFVSPLASLKYNTYLRTLSTTSQGTGRDNVTNLSLLKFDSNGSKNLYAIFKMYNIPYLVTKGDRVILPFKLKGVQVGDRLKLNEVVTIGSPEFTYNDNNGISNELYDLTASVIEITREPYYEVYRKKQRCRRLKTFPVQNHQTHLMINELKLK